MKELDDGCVSRGRGLADGGTGRGPSIHKVGPGRRGWLAGPPRAVSRPGIVALIRYKFAISVCLSCHFFPPGKNLQYPPHTAGMRKDQEEEEVEEQGLQTLTFFFVIRKFLTRLSDGIRFFSSSFINWMPMSSINIHLC